MFVTGRRRRGILNSRVFVHVSCPCTCWLEALLKGYGGLSHRHKSNICISCSLLFCNWFFLIFNLFLCFLSFSFYLYLHFAPLRKQNSTLCEFKWKVWSFLTCLRTRYQTLVLFGIKYITGIEYIIRFIVLFSYSLIR